MYSHDDSIANQHVNSLRNSNNPAKHFDTFQQTKKKSTKFEREYLDEETIISHEVTGTMWKLFLHN